MKENATLESVIEAIDSGRASEIIDENKDDQHGSNENSEAKSDDSSTSKQLSKEELEEKRKIYSEKIKTNRLNIEGE